jgi:hypothetical protein
VGGASLFGVVGGFSEADTTVMNYLGGARVVSGLAVTFAGGIAAMVLVGRTMRRPEEPVDDEPADDERADDKRSDNALAYDNPAADPR